MHEALGDDPKKLMMQAKAGDADAFGRIYELYLTPVYRYIFFRTRNKEEAEDLTQTVFMRVFGALSRFEKRQITPLAYFFTVARNVVIDHWKKKKDLLPEDPDVTFSALKDESGINLHEHLSTEQTIACIKESLHTLKNEQQEVLTLKFIDDLKNREIAELLGKTESAVRQLQCRGLKALKEEVHKRNIPKD